VINFYNDTADATALATLLSLDLDSTIPTILVGDFNIHSPSWSAADWAQSSSAPKLEEWLATQTFTMLTQPAVPTHRGENGARDSTIDLIWVNFAVSIQNSFQGVQVDWEGSLGSDHALIRTVAATPMHIQRNREDRTNRFNMDISPKEWEEWGQIFSQVVPIDIKPTSKQHIDQLIDAIYLAYNTACTAMMKRKGAAPGFASPWWNDKCRDATNNLRNATSEEDRHQCSKTLKQVTRYAKRDWANKFINETNIWEVAAWRHGRRSSHIPALIDHTGTLIYDHHGMSDLLSERFFTEAREDIPTTFPDDPPAAPTREFPDFTKEELFDLLKHTANKSAPGSSGIGWELLKRGWPHMDKLLTNIFTACIHLQHHPACWKEAVVVVIPKPGKTDYSKAKAHRPISLLETMSKLMEKAVAKRFQYDIVKYELIPTNQFGGRTHSSCLDAGLTLIHDIQTAHAHGLKTGILLFDVKGFFDNVNHARLEARLHNMGFSDDLVAWAASFLANRRIRLRFNNITSEDRVQPVGVPQGSPLSPVLSIAYTAPLLGKMANWNNSSLGMYIDDGLLFACAETWDDITNLLRARYSVCSDWLLKVGLSIEPEKTELMFFQKPYERNPMPSPPRIILPDREINSYFTVTPVENLQYLGFFINRRLKWEHHVHTMCNRARASIKALMVLGNSIRGLSMANWRLVLNAVCLPVMTWGCQLWFKEGGTKQLVKMLQQVQNEMVKVVTGAFHTAPREPLLQITRMLPMRHFLEKLTYTSALRLYRLPRNSQLLRRLGHDWYSSGHGDQPTLLLGGVDQPVNSQTLRPTVLEALARRVPSWGPRVDVVAVSPWEVPNWAAQLNYMGVVRPYLRRAWIWDLVSSGEEWNAVICHTAACITKRVVVDLTEVGGAACSYSVRGGPLNAHAWTIGSELTQFDADAFAIARSAETLANIYAVEASPPANFFLLSNNASALQAVKNPRSIKAHGAAIRFHRALTLLSLCHSQISIFLVWAPSDDTLPGLTMAKESALAASWGLPPDGMDRIQSAAFQKDRARKKAFANWEHEFGLERCLAQFKLRWTGDSGEGHVFREQIITEPPSVGHHPLWSAATETKKDENGKKTKIPKYSQRTTSAALQLAVDHAFTGTYARRFRPADPPETTTCPCGAYTRSPSHLILECPRLLQHRINAGIHTHHRTLTLKKLHSSITHVHKLLTFITEGKVAFRPPEFPTVIPIPPEPD
jgi:hypothetical protein